MVPFACMPSPIPRQVEWNLFARTIPFASAFPRVTAGRLLHCAFRGLLSVHSRYGLHARQVAFATLTSEASAASSPPPPPRLLPGGANQLPDGTFTRCGQTPFHGARCECTTGVKWKRREGPA